MHLVNLKHACGHRQEWLLPCAPRTGRRYGLALAAHPCPRCTARADAQRTAEEILQEYDRTLCRRGPPPEGAAPARPWWRRAA
ncbi:MAG: hypothetical protein FJ288_11155 [Planctomycetes bacterium]|nr:hypothetical protein [Planctomycetota bacterium]